MTTVRSVARTQDRRGNALALLASLTAVAVVAVIGGSWTKTDAGSWYSTLELPAWNPPGWAFGVVWTILYALMAVAAWMVWKAGTDDERVRPALAIYAVQLLLNLAWTGIFFALEQPEWALAEIVALFAAVVLTTIAFHRVNARAGRLLVPYLAWVAYAASLNVGIVVLN